MDQETIVLLVVGVAAWFAIYCMIMIPVMTMVEAIEKRKNEKRLLNEEKK